MEKGEERKKEKKQANLLHWNQLLMVNLYLLLRCIRSGVILSSEVMNASVTPTPWSTYPWRLGNPDRGQRGSTRALLTRVPQLRPVQSYIENEIFTR
jgi:hypothetical protein